MGAWSKTGGLWLMNREPNCLAWWQFDRGCVLLNAGGVSIAYDQSLSGDAARTATQDTQLNQPPFTASDADFAGHGSITCSSNQSLATGTWSVTKSVTTDYYVIKTSPTSAAYSNLIDSIDGGTNRHSFSYGPGTTVSMYAGAQVVSSTVATNTVAVICAQFNGANSKIYLNNATTPIATGNCGAQQFTAIRLGNYQGSYPFTGKISLVSIFDGVESADLIAARMRYLGRMYGVAIA